MTHTHNRVDRENRETNTYRQKHKKTTVSMYSVRQSDYYPLPFHAGAIGRPIQAINENGQQR